MVIDELIKKLKELYDKKMDIIQKKNHDYAKQWDVFSNFEYCAKVANIPIEKVMLVFIAVKIARLTELFDKKEALNESIEDTLIDLSNYADLLYVYTKQGRVNNKKGKMDEFVRKPIKEVAEREVKDSGKMELISYLLGWLEKQKYDEYAFAENDRGYVHGYNKAIKDCRDFLEKVYFELNAGNKTKEKSWEDEFDEKWGLWIRSLRMPSGERQIDEIKSFIRKLIEQEKEEKKE